MLGGIIAGGAMNMITQGVGMGLQAHQNKKNQEREDKIRQQTWDREDNAVQRRAKDLELAGINPLLAAGDPAQASTGGGVTGGTAPDAEGLGGAMAQTGQAIDAMIQQKKMNKMMEQKQDAEIAKIEAETESQRLDNEAHEERLERERGQGKNVDADTEKKKAETEKIRRETEKVDAEIDAIRANTELSEEQKKKMIQDRLRESIIKIGEISGSAGAKFWGIGMEGEWTGDQYKLIEDIIEDLQKGKIKTQEAAEEAIKRAEKNKDNKSKVEEHLKKYPAEY